jgi:MoaD family protein
MPMVTVRLFATVREAAGASLLKLDVQDINDLLTALRRGGKPAMSELIDSYLADHERLVILINGRNPGPASLRNLRLSAGDEVAMFPPVSGG